MVLKDKATQRVLSGLLYASGSPCSSYQESHQRG
jgi:hypothetical protein